jgi:tetratricopeptide (TPR) repeat protein
LYRESLAIRLKILDPNHPDVTTSQLNLAGVLQDLGRLDEAEPLIRQALEGDRQTHGEQHMDVAIDLSSLGSLLEERGKFAEAGRMYQESLAIRIALQGEKHPSVPNVLFNIDAFNWCRARWRTPSEPSAVRSTCGLRSACKSIRAWRTRWSCSGACSKRAGG